jgi:hypothetical protein
MDDARKKVEATASALVPQDEESAPAPWEQIEKGRYMPRRIRGSFPGRELG